MTVGQTVRPRRRPATGCRSIEPQWQCRHRVAAGLEVEPGWVMRGARRKWSNARCTTSKSATMTALRRCARWPRTGVRQSARGIDQRGGGGWCMVRRVVADRM